MRQGAWISLAAAFVSILSNLHAVTPPVIRSTFYNGAYSNVVHYSVQPWMTTNSAPLTVEAWIFCNDLDGAQALVARHYSTNLYFGLNTNRLRFYRSGGDFADSDGTVIAGRWTHVAASYDGSFVRFYIDGVNAGVKSLSSSGTANTTLGLTLGGQYHVLNLGDVLSGGYAFSGYLDEVRIWSVARSASAISGNMTNELRSGTGLLATYGWGANQNDIRGETGTTAGIPVSERVNGFGILPSTLCIPFTPNLLRVDGVVDLFNEYRGAETIVLRSRNSSTRPDQVAYLMVSTNVSTNFHLFVGVAGAVQGVSPVPVSQVQCDINPFNGTNLAVGDWECRMDQESFQGGRIYGTNPPFVTTPQWLSWGQSTSNWQAVTAEAFEFHQNYEFRIHGRHLNFFTNPVGLLVRYYDFDAGGDQLVAPRSGITNLPATYARVEWCGLADSDLRSVTISGVVSNVTLGTNQSGWTVTLTSGASETTAQFIRSVSVNSNGTFTISGNVASGQPFHLRLEDRAGYTYFPPEFYGPAGSTPASITGNRTLTYSACFDGPCSPRNVRYRVQSPPGPVAVTGMSVSNGSPEIVLRDSPRKALPGTIVTLFGTNLHDRFDVYLSKCSITPPSFCTPGVDLFPVTVLSNDLARGSLTVQLPADDPQFTGSMRWVMEDRWIGHPGWTQWIYGPSGFVVNRSSHPYPKLWGFEWPNEGDGAGIEDFESAYGQNIFTFIPFPPFKVRDPYYYTFWFPLYLAVAAGSGDGNCHGIAAVSRMFENGTLDLADWDSSLNCGPSGVHYPSGFRGAFISPDLHPCKPSAWTGFDLFEPFRPRNLWALVRQNMMAQFSEEGIQNILNQTAFDGGNPLAVLNRVRTSPAGYILCFQPAGAVGGHCVTPYAVQDGMRLTADSMGITSSNAVNHSIIRVYDNNWPEVERFMEVDRSANQFRYLLGFSDGAPVIWSGRSLYTTPMSFFTSGRHAPGPWNLVMPDRLIRLIFSAGADAEHTNNAGDVWGWDAVGKFTDGYRGSKSYFPYALGFYPDRDLRTGYAFLPTTNAPTGTRINVRGTNFIFQAALDNTAVQFIADQAIPGTGQARLFMSNSTLAGFTLHSGAINPAGSAMIAQPNPGGGSTIYILIGLSLPAAGQIDVIGTEVIDQAGGRTGQKGVQLVNRGGTPLSYTLNVQGADPASGALNNQYGPFNVPAMAALRMTFPEWPDARSVRAETDLGADGTFETVAIVPADFAIFASQEGDKIILRWKSSTQNDQIESTDSLDKPKWGLENGTPQVDGEWKKLELPVSASERYFRVRR